MVSGSPKMSTHGIHNRSSEITVFHRRRPSRHEMLQVVRYGTRHSVSAGDDGLITAVLQPARRTGAMKPPTPHPLPLAQAKGREFHAARLSASGRSLPGCRAAIIRRRTGVRPYRHPDKPRPTATARAGSGRHCRRGGRREPHRPGNFTEPAIFAHENRSKCVRCRELCRGTPAPTFIAATAESGRVGRDGVANHNKTS
jgi:hypothetical protein